MLLFLRNLHFLNKHQDLFLNLQILNAHWSAAVKYLVERLCVYFRRLPNQYLKAKSEILDH